MYERVDIVLGPGVVANIDPYQETSHFDLKVAFHNKATVSTDVVLHHLFLDTGSIVARRRVPKDALLLLMDTKMNDGWRKQMKNWAELRGFSTSRCALLDYDMRAREHAEEYYDRTVWINPQTGLMSLLRVLGEFRRLNQPFSRMLQEGIHYDFMYGQLFVRIAPDVWETLMQKAAKAYAVIPTVAGDKEILISMEAYVDMLRAAE